MSDDKSNVLLYLKNTRNFLKELIEVIKSILNLVFNNKLICLLIILFYLAYEGLNYLAYERPKDIVKRYYELVDNHEGNDDAIKSAFDLFTKHGQRRWENGLNSFVSGYATLGSTRIVNIDNMIENGLFTELGLKKKQFIVELIVMENFTRYDIVDVNRSKFLSNQEIEQELIFLVREQQNKIDSLRTKQNLPIEEMNELKVEIEGIQKTIDNLKIKNEQRENLFWLELKHKSCMVSELSEGKLPPFRSTLKLIRRYRKVFTIQANPNSNFYDRLVNCDWLIDDVDDKEKGVIFDSTFYE